jgi:hypothetical protein
MNKHVISFIFIFGVSFFYAGTTHNPKSFVSSKDVFGIRNFIENKGQYDSDLNGQYKIVAVLNQGSGKIYFTTKGLVYELIKKFPLTKKQLEAMEKGKHIKPKTPKKYHVNMNWLNANANISIEKGEKQVHYFTFGEAKYNSYAYKKLTYTNVYPNIDIEYTIPEDKDYGIKYNLIVNPGANVADIKIAYSGDVDKIKQTSNGSILIKTPLYDITEYAPTTFYENKLSVESAFSLNGDIIGFSLPKGHDQSKTLIIDPFVSAVTTLSANNLGYDVDYDYSGNVYVYGGDAPYYTSKYDNVGNLQWTFSGNVIIPFWTGSPLGNYPGNFVVNKTTGKTYIGPGVDSVGQVIRLDAIGNYDNFIAINSNFRETWDMGFSYGTSEIFALGGSWSSASNESGMLIDQSVGTTSISSFQNFGSSSQDIASHAIDDAGNIFVIYGSYLASLNNKICSVNSNFNGNNWTLPSTFSSLNELFNKNNYLGINLYFGGFNYSSNGFNCLAVNANYLFYYDGLNVAAYDKTTGSILGSTTVSLNLLQQGGIAVDDCNNLYIGGNGSILSYNFNGTTFDTLPNIPLNSGSANPYVFDIKLDKCNNLLYVSGNSFVGTYVAINSLPLSLIPFTYITSSSACLTTSFTAPSFACTSASTPTFSWLFDDPSSGAGNTSVLENPAHTYSSPGYYAVNLVISQACGVDTITQYVAVSGFSITSSITACGKSTASISSCEGGSYTYTWLPSNQTGSVATNLSFGTYSVLATEINSGIIYTTTTQIIAPSTLSVYVTASSPTACLVSNITFTASALGGTPSYNYSWIAGPSTNTLAATKSLAGTYVYTVTATDAASCSVSQIIAVTFVANPTPTVSSNSPVCSLQTLSLTASGGNSYQWVGPLSYNSSNQNPIINSVSVANSGNYIVIVTAANSCTAIASASVNIITQPIILAQPSSQTLVIGSSTQFIVSSSNASSNFQWQQDIGSGFVNLINSSQFSGVTTATLVVSNASLIQNNAGFRCVVSDGNCSDTSLIANLSVYDPTAIKKQAVETYFKLWPNPTENSCTIQVSDLFIGKLYQIIDQIGRLVLIGIIEKQIRN